MNILYCGDENISAGLSLSVLSLIRNNPEELNIYVLTMSLKTSQKTYNPVPEQTIQMLDRELKSRNSNSSIHSIDISKLFLEEQPDCNLSTRFTPYCMLRLFADRLPEIPDRILYLDTDVLCRRDLSEFYSQNMDGYEFAGVLDHYGSWFFRRKLWRRNYCNSGVMLLNMVEIRKTGLFTNCRNLIRTKRFFFPDQTAINKLTRSCKLVSARYNDQRRLHKDTALQHFSTSFRLFPVLHTLTVKPWEFDRVHDILKLHEYDDLFEQYKQLIAKAE